MPSLSGRDNYASGLLFWAGERTRTELYSAECHHRHVGLVNTSTRPASVGYPNALRAQKARLCSNSPGAPFAANPSPIQSWHASTRSVALRFTPAGTQRAGILS